MAFQTQNDLARHFLELHKPGDPVILTNVYDILSTNTLLSLKPKAMASASFAIANSFGVQDPELTMEQNLEALKNITSVIPKSSANPNVLSIPLTADIQDGYGDRLEEVIRKIIGLGIVGCNLEDTYDAPDGRKHVLRPIPEQLERLRTVRRVATELGVPDFVINARVDALYILGKDAFDELLKRGKAYKEIASNLFVWGGPMRGLRDHEVEQLAKELGRINVMASPCGVNGEGSANGIPAKKMAELGVARISCGPYLMKRAMDSYKEAAQALFNGEGLQVKRFGA